MKNLLYELNEKALDFYHQQLCNSNIALKYLKERHIKSSTLENFKIGYAGSNNNLYTYLKEQGYSDEIIIASSLVGKDEEGNYIDRYNNRIIFPVKDIDGKIIAFGGRIIDNSTLKYINNAETDIYCKAESLYGIDIAKDYTDNGIIIVEGYFDYITLYQAGIKNVVALLGTAITDEQIELIKKYTNKVILIFDSDLAGQCATKRAIEKFKVYDIKYTNIKLEGAKDVDEFINKYDIDSLKNLLN